MLCSQCQFGSKSIRIMTSDGPQRIQLCVPCFNKWFTPEGWYRLNQTPKGFRNALQRREQNKRNLSARSTDRPLGGTSLDQS